MEEDRVLDVPTFIGHDVDSCSFAELSRHLLEQEQAVEHDDRVGRFTMDRHLDLIADGRRTAEKATVGHATQGVRLQVGVAQVPAHRNLHEPAQRQALPGGVTQILEAHLVELGPTMLDLPQTAQGLPTMPMGIQRSMHVGGATPTRHRGSLVDMDPVADRTIATTGQVRDPGTPLRQGAADHGLPLDMSRPRTRGQEQHLWPRTHRHGAQPPSCPLFGRAADLALERVQTLAEGSRSPHRWPPGRLSKGRPNTMRPTPAQKPTP